MVLDCGVGEDSWKSLGLQGDPTSPSQRKSVLNIHWKAWCWSWNSNTLAIWCEELTHWKRPWWWVRLMAGEGEDRGRDGWVESWTQWRWVWVTLGVVDRQGSLACCSPWFSESDTTGQLSWTELTLVKRCQIIDFKCVPFILCNCDSKKLSLKHSDGRS